MIGQERHHGGDHLERGAEGVPQCAQRGLVAVPEPAPGPPDVPVRQIVDEAFEGVDDAGRPVALVALRRLSDEGGRARSEPADRKSTRLNSSHSQISYAVFCLKKKTLMN